jgi:hypothetical protein
MAAAVMRTTNKVLGAYFITTVIGKIYEANQSPDETVRLEYCHIG